MCCMTCGHGMNLPVDMLIKMYSHDFTPTGWRLDYETLDRKAENRTLYLVGTCPVCGKEMQNGVEFPMNLTGKKLAIDVWRKYLNYRPFEDKNASGLYIHTNLRTEWYAMQDAIPYKKLAEAFILLFHQEDQTCIQKMIFPEKSKEGVSC